MWPLLRGVLDFMGAPPMDPWRDAYGYGFQRGEKHGYGYHCC